MVNSVFEADFLQKFSFKILPYRILLRTHVYTKEKVYGLPVVYHVTNPCSSRELTSADNQ